MPTPVTRKQVENLFTTLWGLEDNPDLAQGCLRELAGTQSPDEADRFWADEKFRLLSPDEKADALFRAATWLADREPRLVFGEILHSLASHIGDGPNPHQSQSLTPTRWIAEWFEETLSNKAPLEHWFRNVCRCDSCQERDKQQMISDLPRIISEDWSVGFRSAQLSDMVLGKCRFQFGNASDHVIHHTGLGVLFLHAEADLPCLVKRLDQDLEVCTPLAQDVIKGMVTKLSRAL